MSDRGSSHNDVVAQRPAGLSLSTRMPSVSGPTTPMPGNWNSQKPVDPSKSLFVLCQSILCRLALIPSVVPYIEACESLDGDFNPFPCAVVSIPSNQRKLDPVTHVWRLLRMGAPLCELYNSIGRHNLLHTSPPSECMDARDGKRFLYRFLEACLNDQSEHPDSSEEDNPTISHVFSGNTSDLLKVLRLVNQYLDIKDPPATSDGKMLGSFPVSDFDLTAPQSQRDKVVFELIQTERKYVQDLELLNQYHDSLLANGLPRDTAQRLFPFIAKMVDFQRRVLVGLEYQARMTPELQNFGALFDHMKDEFQIYESYTMNQKDASDLAVVEAPVMLSYSDVLEPNHEFQSMLIKPVQRICKYPLLLKQILKYTPHQWPSYPGFVTGLAVVQDINHTVNETQRRIENKYVYGDLRERLRDWRGLSEDHLGDLLLNGLFPVTTFDFELEFHLYLFENALLCCKDGMAAKKSGPLKMRSRQSKRFSLDLKGRIYMSYVHTVRVTKDTTGYILSIVWGQGEAAETGSMTIKLGNEEQAQLWSSTIQRIIDYNHRASAAFELGDDAHDAAGTFFDEPGTPTNGPSSSSSFDSRTLRKLSISSPSSTDGVNRLPGRVSSGASIDNLKLSTQRSASVASASTFMSIGESKLGSFSPTGPTPPSVSSTKRPSYMGEFPSGHSNSHSSAGFPGGWIHRVNSQDARPQSQRRNNSVDSPSSFANPHENGNAAVSSPITDSPHTRVRVHFKDDSFLLLVPEDSSFEQLSSRVERKIRLCGKEAPSPLRLKYKDEDGDLVTLNSDDDLIMAIEERSEHELLLWVS